MQRWITYSVVSFDALVTLLPFKYVYNLQKNHDYATKQQGQIWQLLNPSDFRPHHNLCFFSIMTDFYLNLYINFDLQL